MFSQDRQQLRQFFVQAWEKHQAGQSLQPLERLVADVIAQHPEYHDHLTHDGALERDYTAEDGQTNPWLHMGMHISLGEQLGADRPAGIRTAYQRVLARFGDPHAAEHAMMECLGVTLWEAQRHQAPPDESGYLECLRRLAG